MTPKNLLENKDTQYLSWLYQNSNAIVKRDTSVLYYDCTNFYFATLKNMNVTNVHDIEYMALYDGSKALDALTELTSLDLDRLHYKPKDLNGKIKKMLK